MKHNYRGCVIIARLGRWLNDSAWDVDDSQLASASNADVNQSDHPVSNDNEGDENMDSLCFLGYLLDNAYLCL